MTAARPAAAMAAAEPTSPDSRLRLPRSKHVLDDAADRGRRQQEVAHVVNRRILVEMPEVTHGRGNHTGRAIGGRGNDAAAAAFSSLTAIA